MSEQEVEDIIFFPLEDRAGKNGARIAIGQSDSGRFLKIVYIRDPEPDSCFIITAYELRGKALTAFRRRRRKKI